MRSIVYQTINRQPLKFDNSSLLQKINEQNIAQTTKENERAHGSGLRSDTNQSTTKNSRAGSISRVSLVNNIETVKSSTKTTETRRNRGRYQNTNLLAESLENPTRVLTTTIKPTSNTSYKLKGNVEKEITTVTSKRPATGRPTTVRPTKIITVANSSAKTPTTGKIFQQNSGRRITASWATSAKPRTQSSTTYHAITPRPVAKLISSDIPSKRWRNQGRYIKEPTQATKGTK